MHIKEIETEEEFKQAGELAYLCFHDWEIEKNVEFYKKMKDCYFIGLFEENKLLTAGGSYDFDIFIKNKFLSTNLRFVP